MDWMKEAREIASQCWCEEETKHNEMDVVLGEAFARRLANYMEMAAMDARNTEYYRGLVVRCGEAIGREAYIQDDGGVCEDVLCAKVPELVEALVAVRNELIAWRGKAFIAHPNLDLDIEFAQKEE